MPIWFINKLSIQGPQQVVEEFAKFAEGESPLDFERLVPYPDVVNGPHDEADLPRIDKYEWLAKNWGTKEQAREIELWPLETRENGTAKVGYYFVTSFGPPLPVIKQASALFPSLHFRLFFFEYDLEDRVWGYSEPLRCAVFYEDGRVVHDLWEDEIDWQEWWHR